MDRRGLTMTELLIVVAIIVLVLGIVVVSSRTLRGSQNRAGAQQQMALIAAAIDRYAGTWPKWRIGGVTAADRAWPDHIPGRLFSTTAYQSVSGFNDDVAFVVTDGIRMTPDREERVLPGDVLNANVSLAFALTSTLGKGPFLVADDEEALVKDLGTVLDEPVTADLMNRLAMARPSPILPGKSVGSAGAERAKVLVDPWGTPYRYFWVGRVPTAYKGYEPIVTAGPAFGKADGYVLESAGPDRRFGNVWKSNPSTQEIQDAVDNLTMMP